MSEKHKYVDPDKAFVVHPDIADAMANYDGTNKAFRDTFAARNEAIRDGETYWSTDHDVEMAETAEERSRQPDWTYPIRKPKP